MFRRIYLLLLIVSVSIGFTTAQNFEVHSTGNLDVSVYDEGAIGGIVFMGAGNVSYNGGSIIGNATTKISGHIGSLGIANEMINSVPFSGFSSNANFNQILSCTYSDGGAPASNQTGLTIQQTSYSNTGDNFVILDFIITNNTGSPVNGVYVGQFQDWDIAGGSQNQGGYDASKNIAYQYLPSGIPDSNYYGIVALNGWSGARVTDYGPGPDVIRDSSLAYISTFLNETISTNGDYRMWIGSGPYDIEAGGFVRVGFAICAGVDLTGLQDAATAAQFGWQNFVVSVENEVDITQPLAFTLEQNYPNPFNPSTKIKYGLAEASFVKLSVYNILGQEVKVLVNEVKNAGFYEIDFNATSLTSGTYFYRIGTLRYTETKKMLLIK